MHATASAVALDPQDARPLTSREIAKLLCGMIGSLAAYDERITTVAIAPVIAVALKNPQRFEDMDIAAGYSASRTTWGAALGATIVSLRGWCKPSDIQTALRWVSANLERICSMGDDPTN